MKKLFFISVAFFTISIYASAQDVIGRISESETIQQIVDQLVASNSLNIATRPGNIIYEG